MDSKYLNRQLICWLSYNPYFEDNGTENRVIYLYPRYIVNNGKFEWVDSEVDFPTVGRMAVRVYGKETAIDLYQRLGPLVSVRINTDPQPAYEAKNYYTLRYNPSFGRERSEIWLESVDSTSFYEIKECSQDLNSILRYHQCDSYSDSDCFSNAILLRIGNMLYGPFEPEYSAGIMKLHGLERYDFMIGGYPIARFDQSIITIRDQRDCDAIYALPANALNAPQSCSRSYDMIDQHRLVELFLDRVRAQLNLSRADIRPVTAFCKELFEGNQKIDLSEERLQTIKQLLPRLFRDEDLYKNIIELTIDNDEFREHLISDIISADGDRLMRNLPKAYLDEVKAALLNRTQDELLDDPKVARTLAQQPKEQAPAPAELQGSTANFDFLQDDHTIANLHSLVGEGNLILSKLNETYSSLAFASDPDIDMDVAVNTSALNPNLIAHFMDVGGLIVKLCANIGTVLHAALEHNDNLGDKKAELQELSTALDQLHHNLNNRISELQSSKLLADYIESYQGVANLNVKLEEITTLAGMGAQATQESLAAAQKEAEAKVAQAKAEAQRQIAEAQAQAEQQARLEAAAAEAGIAIAAADKAKKKSQLIKNSELSADAIAQSAAITALNQELEKVKKQLESQQEQNKLLEGRNKQLTEELSLYDEGRANQLLSGSKKSVLKAQAKPTVVHTASEQTTKAIEALDAAISAKQQESKELNLKIAEQNNTISAQQQTLAQLQEQANKITARNKEQEKLAQELEHKFKEALTAYQDRATTALKLIDAKILAETLGTITPVLSAPSITTEVVAPTSVKVKGAPVRSSEVSSAEAMAQLAPNFDTKLLAEAKSVDSAGKILDRVGRYLNDVGHRNLTVNDVANYLICLTQGFITTFAGEPGTGKTSLCNLLARALGLARADGADRFSEVSVERGWTSLKDMIGYYNPLTKRMEKSNAEIFDAFVNLNREAQWASDGSAYDPAKIAPYFILLDEANLSPIEHYWSPFFRNCDFSPLNERTISLGGNANWLLPDHLRFLATVNFDHTTEELSPRFLDRSWVITLEPNVVDLELDELPEHDENMVPFASLLQAFSAQSGDKLDSSLADKWDAIQEIFAHEKCALPLRPRNVRMVYNYCVVAAKCMTRTTTATKFAPLDYAVAQKILPTINGSGERYRYLISELMKECSEQTMPLCAQHLKRIERTGGAELGFYQFFAR